MQYAFLSIFFSRLRNGPMMNRRNCGMNRSTLNRNYFRPNSSKNPNCGNLKMNCRCFVLNCLRTWMKCLNSYSSRLKNSGLTNSASWRYLLICCWSFRMRRKSYSRSFSSVLKPGAWDF